MPQCANCGRVKPTADVKVSRKKETKGQFVCREAYGCTIPLRERKKR